MKRCEALNIPGTRCQRDATEGGTLCEAHAEVVRRHAERDAELTNLRADLRALTAQNKALVDEVAAANAALERAHRELVIVRAEAERLASKAAEYRAERDAAVRLLTEERAKAALALVEARAGVKP